MTIPGFLKSKWYLATQDPQLHARIAQALPHWQARLGNVRLLDKSRQLWRAMTGHQTSRKEKALILGALLYLVTPLDMVPDLIPVVGWMDDLGVAGMVLGYLCRKLDEQEKDLETDEFQKTQSGR